MPPPCCATRQGAIAAPIDSFLEHEKLVDQAIFLDAIAMTVPEDMPTAERERLCSLLADRGSSCAIVCPGECLRGKAGTRGESEEERCCALVPHSATLALMMTSGTTGSPKFVKIPQYYIEYQTTDKGVFKLVEKGVGIAYPGTFMWVSWLIQTAALLQLEGCMTVSSSPQNEDDARTFWSIMARYHCERCVVWPHFLRSLTSGLEDRTMNRLRSCLRGVMYGGSKVRR